MNLAIERGEVDGRCGWSWDSIKSTRPEWLRDKKINLLAVFSLQRAADIPAEVPLISDLAASDEQRLDPAHSYGGAGVGAAVLHVARRPRRSQGRAAGGLDATMADPDFIAETTKVKLEVNPATGAEVDRLLAEVYATPKDVIEKAKQAVRN